jgi:hypothetical protein
MPADVIDLDPRLVTVHERELARRAAMTAADTDSLDDLLAEQARWIHGSSKIDTKASLISTIGTGAVHYLELTGSDEDYRFLTDTVVLAHCTIRMRSEAGGIERAPLSLLNTLVWRLDGERWRIEHYQSTILPELSA